MLAAVAAFIWRLTPLADLMQPEEITRLLDVVEKSRFAPLYFIGAYLVGGLIMFPVTVLSASTAIVFPPWKAVCISFTGIMLSAALLHWLGMLFMRNAANPRMRNLMKRVDAAMSDRGIVAIATLRMIPLAPFTLVNLAAGALGVRFKDYILGTALGLAPGMTVVLLFGRQVRSFWSAPTWNTAISALAICVAWICVSLLLQRWLKNRGA